MQKVRLFHNFILETGDFKILQSDWLRAFWPVCLEPGFSQVCTDLHRNMTKNMNFHYKLNLQKINDEIFQ